MVAGTLTIGFPSRKGDCPDLPRDADAAANAAWRNVFITAVRRFQRRSGPIRFAPRPEGTTPEPFVLCAIER
jgi:hypothetical protein